jgi:hypothetical protein
MANQAKPEKSIASSIKYGSSNGVSLHKDIIKELSIIVRVEHLFLADEVSFATFSGCSFDTYLIQNRYEKFLTDKVEAAFGCPFPKEYFKKSIVEVCVYLTKNRKNTPVKSDHSNFLGILYLKELYKDEYWSIQHPYTLKYHVDYFSGYIFGKVNPLNGPPEMKASIMKDFESMNHTVYGKFDKPQWEIKTEEGDCLLFNNLNEVFCWLTARASNYSPDSMTKECW